MIESGKELREKKEKKKKGSKALKTLLALLFFLLKRRSTKETAPKTKETAPPSSKETAPSKTKTAPPKSEEATPSKTKTAPPETKPEPASPKKKTGAILPLVLKIIRKKGGVRGASIVLLEALLEKLKERVKEEAKEKEKEEEKAKEKETAEPEKEEEIETIEPEKKKALPEPAPDFPNSANVRGIAKGKNGEIYVLFSRGEIYRYEPSMTGMIYASLLKPYTALTSGENVFKKWRKGTPSIGGSFWQLVAKPSRRIAGTYKKVSSAPQAIMQKRSADRVYKAVSSAIKRIKT